MNNQPIASTSNLNQQQSINPSVIQKTTTIITTNSSNSNKDNNKDRDNDNDSLRYTIISGIAGGIAGCVAKTSVAPLDRVKILFQTRSPDYTRYAGTYLGVFRASKDIYSETGIRGLLQGHSATLLRIFPYAAIKYMAYEKFHLFIMPTPATETSGRRFLAGSLAGVTSAMITYPLELIRVRLAFEPHHSTSSRSSLLRTMKQIYLEPPLPLHSTLTATTTASAATSPISIPNTIPSSTNSNHLLQNHKPSLTHFYRGLLPTLIGIIPYAGTSFLIWGYLRHDFYPYLLSPTFLTTHRTALDLIAGGLAGGVGQTVAYPLDIVRRRMQVGPATPSTSTSSQGGGRSGFWETGKGVYKIGGWRAFFVGLSIGYLKVAPMNAVSFATWVGLKEAFGLEGGSR